MLKERLPAKTEGESKASKVGLTISRLASGDIYTINASIIHQLID
jgi:hypothetical protein